MEGLNQKEAIVMLVHEFVNRKVMPVVQELHHANTLFASETVLNAIRIHGDYGYSAEFDVVQSDT